MGALLCCGAGHVDVASVTAEGSTVELAELEKREKRGKSKSLIGLERCRVLGVEVKTVDDEIAALILGNTATTEQRRAAAVGRLQ